MATMNNATQTSDAQLNAADWQVVQSDQHSQVSTLPEPDLGRVRLEREVTDASIFALVNAIYRFCKTFFYHKVVVELASPGGSVLSLQYFIDSLKRIKDEFGVEIVTQALTTTASAAAQILSLGDKRYAAPSANLLWHNSRVAKIEDATAEKAKELAEGLSASDKAAIEALKPKIEAARHGNCTYTKGALKNDLAKQKRDGGQVLLDAVVLDQMFPNGDVETLTIDQMLKNLYRTDRSISPYFAKELGLIDEVGMYGSAAAKSSNSTGSIHVEVKEWKKELVPGGEIPVEELCRHVYITGETGSGKTASAILPLLKGIAQVKVPKPPSILVVDPKDELYRQLAKPGLVNVHDEITNKSAIIAIPTEIDKKDGTRKMTESLFRTMVKLDPTNPLAEKYGNNFRSGGDRGWLLASANTAELVLRIVLFVKNVLPSMLDVNELPKANKLFENSTKLGIVKDIKSRLDKGDSVIDVALVIVDRVLNSTEAEDSDGKVVPMRGGSWSTIADQLQFVSELVSVENAIAKELAKTIPKNPRAIEDGINECMSLKSDSGIRFFAAQVSGNSNTYLYEVQSLRRILSPFERMTGAFFEGIDDKPTTTGVIDGKKLLEPGKTHVYSHGKSHVQQSKNQLYSMALKISFYHACLARKPNDVENHLAAYVCDEFQNFITTDKEHGELYFTDRCRAMNVCCVFATQSTVQLEHVLSAAEAETRRAVNALLVNLGMKIMFRSTDPATMEYHGKLLNDPIVAQARPLIQLKPGECWMFRSDGSVSRGHVQI